MFMASLICNLDDDCEKLLVCKMELNCVKTLQFEMKVLLCLICLNINLHLPDIRSVS